MQILGDYLKTQETVHGHDQQVEFESESICLDVPHAGVTTEDQSWTITPLHHPEVYIQLQHA